MVSSADDSTAARRRYASIAHGVAWLKRHPGLVVALTAAGIATALILDLVIPGYAIAGFYLIPVMLVALALRVRLAVAVSVLCLALTVWVMVRQDRVDGQNILLIAFGVVGGIGLIALADLFNRVEDLYESERSSRARLQSATARLATLQKVSVAVNGLMSREEILDLIVRSGAELLDANCLVMSRDGSASRTHVACSEYAEVAVELEEGEGAPIAADAVWSSVPIGEGPHAAAPPAAVSGPASSTAAAGRLLRVTLDARPLGVDEVGAEAALVFARRSGEPAFDREDEALAATLGALLSAALGRAYARV